MKHCLVLSKRKKFCSVESSLIASSQRVQQWRQKNGDATSQNKNLTRHALSKPGSSQSKTWISLVCDMRLSSNKCRLPSRMAFNQPNSWTSIPYKCLLITWHWQKLKWGFRWNRTSTFVKQRYLIMVLGFEQKLRDHNETSVWVLSHCVVERFSMWLATPHPFKSGFRLTSQYHMRRNETTRLWVFWHESTGRTTILSRRYLTLSQFLFLQDFHWVATSIFIVCPVTVLVLLRLAHKLTSTNIHVRSLTVVVFLLELNFLFLL